MEYYQIPMVLLLSWVFYEVGWRFLAHKPTVNVYLGLGVALFFYILIVGRFVRKFIKNSTTIYSMALSEKDFTYYEKSKKGSIKKTCSIPLNNLGAIGYNYHSSDYDRILYLYIKEQFKEKCRLEEAGELPDSSAQRGLNKKLLQIETKGLSPLEMLHLERGLQQVVKGYSGAEVL